MFNSLLTSGGGPSTERHSYIVLFWLFQMLKQMWPYIGEYAKDVLKRSVEPAIQNSLPNSLKPFKFERIDLGDIVSNTIFETFRLSCHI